jgi:hypothetical protein
MLTPNSDCPEIRWLEGAFAWSNLSPGIETTLNKIALDFNQFEDRNIMAYRCKILAFF